MTGVATVFALISDGVEQKVVTKSAKHELIELPLYKLVAILLVNFILALADGALSTETLRAIQRPLAYVLLHCSRGLSARGTRGGL